MQYHSVILNSIASWALMWKAKALEWHGDWPAGLGQAHDSLEVTLGVLERWEVVQEGRNRRSVRGPGGRENERTRETFGKWGRNSTRMKMSMHLPICGAPPRPLLTARLLQWILQLQVWDHHTLDRCAWCMASQAWFTLHRWEDRVCNVHVFFYMYVSTCVLYVCMYVCVYVCM